MLTRLNVDIDAAQKERLNSLLPFGGMAGITRGLFDMFEQALREQGFPVLWAVLHGNASIVIIRSEDE